MMHVAEALQTYYHAESKGQFMCVIFCLAHAARLLPKMYHLLSICTNTFIKISTVVLQCTKCNIAKHS